MQTRKLVVFVLTNFNRFSVGDTMFHRVKSEASETPTKVAQFTKSEAQPEVEEELREEELRIEEDVEYSADIDVEESEQASEIEVDDQTNHQSNNQKEENQEMSQNETQSPETPAENAYQRTTATSANVGGYPGSTPSYGGYATPTNEPETGDRRLTIGAGITMSGEIESCDYLLVEGTVEAALKGAQNLDIAETGVFYGTVEIEDATISGRFEGDITAHGRLTLRESATVTGTIAYKELEIEAGAVIDGKLTPLSAVSQAAKPAPAKARGAKSEPRTQTQAARPQPANTDGGGLFTKATAAAE